MRTHIFFNLFCKIITESGILKEAKEDYIILELENEIKKTIKIKYIIKARLNC